MAFVLEKVARKNILELTPYRCARDVRYLQSFAFKTFPNPAFRQDYSEGVLLDANENSRGAAVTSHEHLKLNR